MIYLYHEVETSVGCGGSIINQPVILIYHYIVYIDKYRSGDIKVKKERFEQGDKLIFTGQEYNLAKIFNYAEIFKDKELIVESIQRCPCEENKNDTIKFVGIDGFYRSIFFDKKE